MVASPSSERVSDRDTSEEVVPKSIARIRRLEKMEQERLEGQVARRRQREQHIADHTSSGGRHDVVATMERVTRFPLVVLGAAWLVLLVIDRSVSVSPSTNTTLLTAVYLIWVVIFVEYGVRLLLTPHTGAYLRRRWIEPVAVALPALQGWHLVGVEKVTLVVHEMALRVLAILRHHNLARVILGAVVIIATGAWLVMLYEQNVPDATIKNYPGALWWAIVTVTTVGYGDKYPLTAGGRIVASVLMLVGIGLIGTLTATVASVFVKEHTDDTRAAVAKGHEDLRVQIDLIRDSLRDIELRLGATATDEDALVAEAETEAAAEEGTEGPLLAPDTKT